MRSIHRACEILLIIIKTLCIKTQQPPDRTQSEPFLTESTLIVAQKTKEAHLRKICTANSYSNDCIRRFIRRHLQTRTMATTIANGNPTLKWHTILYTRTASEGSGCMLAKYGIRVTHKLTKQLRSQLMLAKDLLKDEEKSGVMYHVNSE